MAKNGFKVHCVDFPGHGRTTGHPAGHVGDAMMVDKVIDLLLSFDKDTRLSKFMLGQSMGGLNAFRYCVERKPTLDGILIASPAFGLDEPPNAVKVFFGSLLSHIAPCLAVDNELNPDDLSRVPEEVKRYKEDLLVHRKISLLTAKTLLDYQDWLQRTTNPIAINLPVLLCHGTGDRMTSPSASKRVYGRIACEDKTLKLYEGAYHSLHYDTIGEQVTQDWLDWICQHTPTADEQ